MDKCIYDRIDTDLSLLIGDNYFLLTVSLPFPLLSTPSPPGTELNLQAPKNLGEIKFLKLFS